MKIMSHMFKLLVTILTLYILGCSKEPDIAAMIEKESYGKGLVQDYAKYNLELQSVAISMDRQANEPIPVDLVYADMINRYGKLKQTHIPINKKDFFRLQHCLNLNLLKRHKSKYLMTEFAEKHFQEFSAHAIGKSEFLLISSNCIKATLFVLENQNIPQNEVLYLELAWVINGLYQHCINNDNLTFLNDILLTFKKKDLGRLLVHLKAASTDREPIGDYAYGWTLDERFVLYYGIWGSREKYDISELKKSYSETLEYCRSIHEL